MREIDPGGILAHPEMTSNPVAASLVPLTAGHHAVGVSQQWAVLRPPAGKGEETSPVDPHAARWRQKQEPDDMATITLEIRDEQAEALAQMVKRFCWQDAQRLAADDQETRAVLDGIATLRSALAREGYAPR